MIGAGGALSARRRAMLVSSLLAGLVIFLSVVHRHYPIERWLFWVYLRFSLVAAVLVLACVSVGHFAIVRGFRLFLPLRERLFMSFALGLAIFGWGMCLWGHLHWFGRGVLWAWPSVCFLAGAPQMLDYGRRWKAHAGRRAWRPAGLRHVVTAAGCLGLLVVYGGILHASVAGYDARWYHLALAEHYVAAGGIVRFPEGFFGGTWPHSASWVYAWGFLSADDLFSRIEQSLHLEFAVFAMTLVGLPVLVRWILAGRRAPEAWVAMFTFPSLFLYDASLNGTSDHFLAMWAVALGIVTTRAWRSFDLRHALLFAVMTSAAASTKYQSINVLAFPIMVFLAAGFRARHRISPSKMVACFAAALVTAVILWSPHWLKNFVWYGDPLYPLLRGRFTDRPWVPGATTGYAPDNWRPVGPPLVELGRSLRILATFSFAPHDWALFHRDIPVFGSLFTLALAPLVFLPRLGRAWFFASAALVGVFVWFWTFHQDRYLQALVPWMAAVVAAVLVRLWETKDIWVRGATSLLVGAQIVWGSDVPFLPTHVSLWRPPLQATMELLSTAYRGDYGARVVTSSQVEPLAPLFPAGARVLLHESELRLGTGTQVVTDARGAQGGIDYAAWRSPARIGAELRAMNVTHLVWSVAPSRARMEQVLSNEVAFLNFAARCDRLLPRREQSLLSCELPRVALPELPPVVVLHPCDAGPSLVPFDAIDRIPSGRAHFSGGAPSMPDVRLLDERCSPKVPDGYRLVGRFPPFLVAVPGG